jgi:hypothetical protein
MLQCKLAGHEAWSDIGTTTEFTKAMTALLSLFPDEEVVFELVRPGHQWRLRPEEPYETYVPPDATVEDRLKLLEKRMSALELLLQEHMGPSG